MEKVLIAVAIIFGSLFILTKVLEGRAEPLTAEQSSKLSSILRVLMVVVIVGYAIKYFVG